VQRNKFYYFGTINEFLGESGKAASENVKRHMTEDLRQLQNLFDEYFLPRNTEKNWLRNPFIGSLQKEDFRIKEYEQLIDIASYSI
jgi:hypothetical protein